MFVDPTSLNYHLQPDSPACEAGKNGVDMGIYEHDCSGQLSPTLNPQLGNANDDGRVTIADYIIWLNHYGMTTGNGPKDGDFDNSGSVGIADYIIWLNNYGT